MDSCLQFEVDQYEQGLEERRLEDAISGRAYIHFCASESDAHLISTSGTLLKSQLAHDVDRAEYSAAYAVRVGGILDASNHLNRTWAVVFNTDAMVSESFETETLFPTNDHIVISDCCIVRACTAKAMLDGTDVEIHENHEFLMNPTT